VASGKKAREEKRCTELRRRNVLDVNGNILTSCDAVRTTLGHLINLLVSVTKVFKLENPRVIMGKIFLRMPR
jgi:hypothetical protein